MVVTFRIQELLKCEVKKCRKSTTQGLPTRYTYTSDDLACIST